MTKGAGDRQGVDCGQDGLRRRSDDEDERGRGGEEKI